MTDKTLWKSMESAPMDGTWFIALRAVTLIGAGREPTAIPEMMLLRRKRTTPDSRGYWSDSHGDSVADDYVNKGLWAPLDALPLSALYQSARARGETPFPLSAGEGDNWIDRASRIFQSIADQS